MNIICPECGTKYRLPDDKFKENARFRCSVCKNVFSLSGGSSEQMQGKLDQSVAMMESNLSFSGIQDKDAMGVAQHNASTDNSALNSDGGTALSLNQTSGGMAQDEPLSIQETPKKHGTSWFFCILLLLIALGGTYWALLNTHYLDTIKPWLYGNAPQQVFEWLPALKADKIKYDVPQKQQSSFDFLELREVRQYVVENGKLGKILVIEGKVKNNATDACDMIQLEADLYAEDGRKLVSKRQVAGAFVSKLQLEGLEKAELEDLINNKVSIISNNFNVRFGDEAPFTMLFDNVPPEATDYRIRIADASFHQSKGNLAP